jgi:hypothetical protein
VTHDAYVWKTILAVWVLTVLALVSLISIVNAQTHDHATEVGKFYEKWLTPHNRMPDGSRNISCCNNQDCAPVDHVRYFNGALQMQRKLDGQWLTIPPEKLETNYDDARDSPDGFSHMCSKHDSVYCAVLGHGI